MREKSNKSLVKNASLNVIKQVCTLAFSLITFPYVSRVLGDASYGKYSFATSIIEYLLIFSASAGGAYAIREGARIKNNNKEITTFSSEIFSIGCLFTISAYVVLFLLFILFPRIFLYKNLLLILSLRLLATTIGVEWIFNIFEDFKNITIRQISVQIIGLILTLILVHSPNDVNLYAIATVVAMSGANLINFFVSRKYVKIKFTKKMHLKQHIRPIMLILFYSAMITIYSNADIIMLGLMTNDSVVGAYSVAAKIYGIAKNIFIAALTVLLPRMSSYLGNNDITKMKEVINKTLKILLIGLVPAIILLFYYSNVVIFIVAGNNYLQGTVPLQLLSIALLFAIISSLLTTNIMIPNRQENKITIIVTISALSNIILNYLMIPIFGGSAASITTVIAEMIVCIGSIIYTKSYIEFKKLFFVISKILLASFFMLLILFIVSIFNLSGILELFIGSIIACIGYIFCLIALKIRSIKEFIKIAK